MSIENTNTPLESTDEPQALVHGKPLHEFPQDLYVPPNALEVFLDAFTGPLDLLLYLIKKENINILDIPIAQITTQYMEYVEMMKDLNLDLAAEYLVMAAVLAEIKSKMLLPKPPSTECEEGDPRAELVRRLREYERFKKAAEDLDVMPRVEREIFPVSVKGPETPAAPRPLPKLELQELLVAFKDVYQRANMFKHHQVNREGLSIRERMSNILSSLKTTQFVKFESMFKVEEGRIGVVVTFIAILELLRQNLIEIIQNEIYGSIYLKTVKGEEN
jgi:segregation and condensation protein A